MRGLELSGTLSAHASEYNDFELEVHESNYDISKGKRRICCKRHTVDGPMLDHFMGTDSFEHIEEHPDCIKRTWELNRDLIIQKFTYDVDDWLHMFLTLEGRTMPWKPMMLTMGFTFIVLFVHERYWGMWPSFASGVDVQVHSSFGVVLGFLIVYQTGQSARRWWEARVSWEVIMVQSKEAMRLLAAHCDVPDVLSLFGMHLTAFACCTKHFLRGTLDDDAWRAELRNMLDEDDVERIVNANPRMRPVACLYACQRCVEYVIQQKLMERAVSRDINPRLTTLADELGVCERILYTPLPWIYTLHLRFVIMLYLMILPLVFCEFKKAVSEEGVIFYCFIISYAFLGLEDMALEIQNPFGDDYSDLPLDVFTNIIFQDVKIISQLKYCVYGDDYTDNIKRLCARAKEFDKDDH